MLGNHWTRWSPQLFHFMNTVQGQSYAILKISSNTYSRTVNYRFIFMAQVDEGASSTVWPWPKCLSNQHCFAAAIAYRLLQRGDQKKKGEKRRGLPFFFCPITKTIHQLFWNSTQRSPLLPPLWTPLTPPLFLPFPLQKYSLQLLAYSSGNLEKGELNWSCQRQIAM